MKQNHNKQYCLFFLQKISKTTFKTSLHKIKAFALILSICFFELIKFQLRMIINKARIWESNNFYFNYFINVLVLEKLISVFCNKKYLK